MLESELSVLSAVPVAQDGVDEETLLAGSLADGDGGAVNNATIPVMRFEEATNSIVVDELGQTMTLAQMEQSVLGRTLSPEGVLDGGLIDMLRRLALGATLDDALVETA